MFLQIASYLEQRCLDFLDWYEQEGSRWKILLIPIYIVVYSIILLSDMISVAIEWWKDYYDY